MDSVWPPGVGLNTSCTSLQGWFWVVKDLFKRCSYNQAEIQRENRTLSTNIVEQANGSNGKHRASCDARDGVHFAKREERFTRNES